MRLSELRSRSSGERERERVIEGYGFQDRFNVDLTNTSIVHAPRSQKIPVAFDDRSRRKRDNILVIILFMTYNIVIEKSMNVQF